MHDFVTASIKARMHEERRPKVTGTVHLLQIRQFLFWFCSKWFSLWFFRDENDMERKVFFTAVTKHATLQMVVYMLFAINALFYLRHKGEVVRCEDTYDCSFTLMMAVTDRCFRYI